MFKAWIRRLIAGTQNQRNCDLHSGSGETKYVSLLAHAESASISYLIAPYLAQQGIIADKLDSSSNPPTEISNAECRLIVIVRYLPRQWIQVLREFKKRGGQLVYFMDDDLMDPAAITGLPRLYATKIKRNAIARRDDIERLCEEYWVSSPYLMEKYHVWNPRLLSANPPIEVICSRVAPTVCYHGTASHAAELTWLVDVMAEVQKTSPDSMFEIFGDHSVNRSFRDIPRVSVLHPMSWPAYLAFTSSVRRDIALAPLLPGPFNAARGPTKFFDFVRMGAVGIYSDVEPYRGFVRDGIDGILLPNDPATWASTIVQLMHNVELRERMVDAARMRAYSRAFNE